MNEVIAWKSVHESMPDVDVRVVVCGPDSDPQNEKQSIVDIATWDGGAWNFECFTMRVEFWVELPT